MQRALMGQVPHLMSRMQHVPQALMRHVSLTVIWMTLVRHISVTVMLRRTAISSARRVPDAPTGCLHSARLNTPGVTS